MIHIVEATNTKAIVDSRLALIENPNMICPGQIVFIPTGSPALSERIEPTIEGVGWGVWCLEEILVSVDIDKLLNKCYGLVANYNLLLAREGSTRLQKFLNSTGAAS